MIAYLRLIQNPYDSVSLMRVINVPGRGIGQHTLDDLNQWAGIQGISQYEALQRLAGPESDGSGSAFQRPGGQNPGQFRLLLKELIAQQPGNEPGGLFRPGCYPVRL